VALNRWACKRHSAESYFYLQPITKLYLFTIELNYGMISGASARLALCHWTNPKLVWLVFTQRSLVIFCQSTDWLIGHDLALATGARAEKPAHGRRLRIANEKQHVSYTITKTTKVRWTSVFICWTECIEFSPCWPPGTVEHYNFKKNSLKHSYSVQHIRLFNAPLVTVCVRNRTFVRFQYLMPRYVLCKVTSCSSRVKTLESPWSRP